MIITKTFFTALNKKAFQPALTVGQALLSIFPLKCFTFGNTSLIKKPENAEICCELFLEIDSVTINCIKLFFR